jgi:hypothetical protein
MQFYVSSLSAVLPQGSKISGLSPIRLRKSDWRKAPSAGRPNLSSAHLGSPRKGNPFAENNFI